MAGEPDAVVLPKSAPAKPLIWTAPRFWHCGICPEGRIGGLECKSLLKVYEQEKKKSLTKFITNLNTLTYVLTCI